MRVLCTKVNSKVLKTSVKETDGWKVVSRVGCLSYQTIIIIT